MSPFTQLMCALSPSFGAVLEEFELRDALENVLAAKTQMPALSQAMATQQIAAY